MSKNKKTKDERLSFTMRYRFDEAGRVEFIDPCCDDIPVVLFCSLMEAFVKVQNEYNHKIEKKQ